MTETEARARSGAKEKNMDELELTITPGEVFCGATEYEPVWIDEHQYSGLLSED